MVVMGRGGEFLDGRLVDKWLRERERERDRGCQGCEGVCCCKGCIGGCIGRTSRCGLFG